IRAVGLFDAPGQALLNEQGFTDLLEEITLTAKQKLSLFETGRNRHDPIKGLRDPALVVGKRHARRQGLGQQQQPFRSIVSEADAAVGKRLILSVGLEQDGYRFGLALTQWVDQAPRQVLDDGFFFQRVEADEHGGAEPK